MDDFTHSLVKQGINTSNEVIKKVINEVGRGENNSFGDVYSKINLFRNK